VIEACNDTEQLDQWLLDAIDLDDEAFGKRLGLC
jgi:hypothetical protein